MKKLFNYISVIFIIFSLTIPPGYAGELMEAGTVLEETSMVFTVEEAQGLRQQIITLENEVDKRDEIISEQKILSSNLTGQVIGLESIVELKDLQLSEYKDLHELDLSRIKKLDRQSNIAKAERWGFLALGVGLTVGSILVADKIDDAVEFNPSNSNINVGRSIPLFKF